MKHPSDGIRSLSWKRRKSLEVVPRFVPIVALLLVLWPHATAIEPPLQIPCAGFQLILLVRPPGKVFPKGRSIEAILRDPLGH